MIYSSTIIFFRERYKYYDSCCLWQFTSGRNDQDWNWEEYPIIRFDFNMITNTDTEILTSEGRIDMLVETEEKCTFLIRPA
jgi:hypothetical protein